MDGRRSTPGDGNGTISGAKGLWSRRATLRFGALGSAGLAVFAAACGRDDRGKDGHGARSNGRQARVGEPSPAHDEQHRYGGVIVQRLPTDPDRLDLHQSTTYPSIWSTAPCFNQLVQFDPLRPDDTPQDIIPDLGQAWEQPDAQTLIFRLRPGVTFHDGSDFTSEDVKVQLDWIRNPPEGKVSPRKGALGAIARIQTPEPGGVRIDFSRPNPSILMNLAGHHFTIGQARDIIVHGEVGPKLIGTGPFRLKSYQRGIAIELEKNPQYHVPGRPYLDGLKFLIVPDYAGALANFQAGQYHLFYDVQFSVPDQEDLKKALGERVQMELVPTTQRDLVFLNAGRRPYDDLRVRQAVSLALDRDAAVKIVKQGAGRRGGYMVPTGVWAISEEDLRRLDGYDRPDIDGAKRLLATAGVSTPINASATTRTDYKNIAEFVKDGLARIGINLQLTLADAAAAQPVMQRGDFDISPWVIGINVDDPDATFAEIATSKAVRNWSRLSNPEIDALFEKQSQTLDFGERKKLVQELERRALSHYGVAVLYFQDASFAKYTSVRDYVFHGSQSTNRRMESVWLKS